MQLWHLAQPWRAQGSALQPHDESPGTSVGKEKGCEGANRCHLMPGRVCDHLAEEAEKDWVTAVLRLSESGAEILASTWICLVFASSLKVNAFVA